MTHEVHDAAHEYLSNILRHSNEDARTGSFARDDSVPLANFAHRLLILSPESQTIPAPGRIAQEDMDFVSIYTLQPGGVVATRFDSERGIETQPMLENQDCSNVIVLRGYPHLQSLCQIGAAYNIDPVLYQRHMHYLTTNNLGGSSSLYSLPVLPSFRTNATIFQLNLTTILQSHSLRSPTEPPDDVGHMRQECAEQLRQYHRKLVYCQAAPGDSVVQHYSLLSMSNMSSALDHTTTLSAIDQTITIGIIPTPTAWTAVVWTDSGRDLAQSLPGPWRHHHHVSATGSVPVAGGIHGHATQPQRDRLGLAQQDDLGEPLRRHPTASTATVFPNDLGQLFNNTDMGHDALFALSNVLQIAAASQRQLLSVLWGLLDREMVFAGQAPASPAPMANVCFMKQLADRHIGRLASTVLILESRDQHNWPRAPPGTREREEADRAVTMLLRDFSHLQDEAKRLSASLGESIQFLATDAAFQESVKSISNARRVERLTLLATIFLPLTFTCSAFGMNFSVFGQGELSIWIYFPVAAIVVIASFLAWYFSSGEYNLRMWTCS